MTTGERLTAHQRGYTAKWQRESKVFLRANPLCVFCQREGKLRQASVVDHIIAHKGDAALFWNPSNWQPLCKHCHDSTKQRIERSGTVPGCLADGTPIDPNHSWNN